MLDTYQNRNEGVNKSVVEPVGNLIPGVGEVVIVGVVAVCVVAGADWIYDHPAEALHGLADAAKGIDDGINDVGRAVVTGVKTAVHYMEPWHW